MESSPVEMHCLRDIIHYRLPLVVSVFRFWKELSFENIFYV